MPREHEWKVRKWEKQRQHCRSSSLEETVASKSCKQKALHGTKRGTASKTNFLWEIWRYLLFNQLLLVGNVRGEMLALLDGFQCLHDHVRFKRKTSIYRSTKPAGSTGTGDYRPDLVKGEFTKQWNITHDLVGADGGVGNKTDELLFFPFLEKKSSPRRSSAEAFLI